MSDRNDRKEDNVLTIAFEWIIFSFRYALMGLYVFMTLAGISYLVHSAWETGVFAVKLWSSESSENLVGVLTLLDDMMITSLLFLIIGGSYFVYVRKWVNNHVFRVETDRPPAFIHLTPTSLKLKMALALVGVSAVLILRILVEARNVGIDDIDLFAKRSAIAIIIHIVLVLSALLIARVLKQEDGNSDHSTPTEAEAAHHA